MTKKKSEPTVPYDTGAPVGQVHTQRKGKIVCAYKKTEDGFVEETVDVTDMTHAEEVKAISELKASVEEL